MRTRVERLLGRAHPWDVALDISLGLRADTASPRPEARLHGAVHDLRPGRRPPPCQAVHARAWHGSQALHARGRAQPHLAGKERAARRRGLRRDGGRQFEEVVGDVYELYERELERANAHGLRRPAAAHRARCWSATRMCASATQQSFRHILVDEYQDTNHAQYRLLRLLCGDEPGERCGARSAGCTPQPGRGRRRRPVGLRLPRRRRPQHPRLPEGLPGRARGEAGAELPLDADDPARRERADREQPR